jgi:hypothetical protein
MVQESGQKSIYLIDRILCLLENRKKGRIVNKMDRKCKAYIH